MIRWFLCVLMITVGIAAGQDRMSPELLWKLGRVGGGSLSPSGTELLYSVRRYELADNKGDSDLFIRDMTTNKTRRITSGPSSEGAVQWVKTKKGVRVFFTSRRDGVEGNQAWALNLADGALTQVTAVKGGIGNLVVAPSGDRIAFTREIKLDQTVNELFKDLPQAEARIIDGLMYRHWDAWHDFKYTHLHVAELSEDLAAKPARDLMEGMKVDCPVPPFAGSEQIAFSPDGKEIAFTMKVANDWAQSTDSDVYVVPTDGSKKIRCLTSSNPGYDNDPVYSPDGRHLYFMSMRRGGFESDKNRIMRYDRKEMTTVEMTEGLDQTAHGVVATKDGKTLYFRSEYRGVDHLFSMDTATRRVSQITKGAYNWSLRDLAGDHLIVGRQNMVRPWELGRIPAKGGDFEALTNVNDKIFAKLDLPKVEERWVDATDGKKIHCWVIYPPKFDPKKKYGMLTYFQGGPQGQIGQWFSYRWNFHLMASHGDYVVVAPNRRGLPGFGRAWNDEISGDWGGQAMEDILAAHDAMTLEPFIDPKRVGGIGASFGGYTAYWMMGNASERFACMISHCGVFNLESMYGTTEELFFVDWDLGGPYWKSEAAQEKYDRFSPHRFIKNWSTPLLVIHGQRDFRVPVTQGMEAFQAAQIEGVPSRFLYFPDEGHWVLSPQNGVLWHRVFFDWLGRHLKSSR